MYVAFLKYSFVENFNTLSQSHQPIPWNCNSKSLGAEEPRAEDRHMGLRVEGREKPIPCFFTLLVIYNSIYEKIILQLRV